MAYLCIVVKFPALGILYFQSLGHLIVCHADKRYLFEKRPSLAELCSVANRQSLANLKCAIVNNLSKSLNVGNTHNIKTTY